MLNITANVDIGIGPSQNDDRALVNDHIIKIGEYEVILDSDICLATVCDGVGGEDYGYEAAQITSKIFSKMWGNQINKTTIESSIYTANNSIIKKQKSSLNYRRIATTLAGVYIEGPDYIVFNVGDSRVYRFRNKYVSLLTKDHSLVQELVDLNILSPKEAKTDSRKNIITRYIGHPTDFDGNIDIYKGALHKKDILLVCSDGLSDFLTEDDFEDILSNYKKWTFFKKMLWFPYK